MDSGAAKITTDFTDKRTFGNHRGLQYFHLNKQIEI